MIHIVFTCNNIIFKFIYNSIKKIEVKVIFSPIDDFSEKVILFMLGSVSTPTCTKLEIKSNDDKIILPSHKVHMFALSIKIILSAPLSLLNRNLQLILNLGVL